MKSFAGISLTNYHHTSSLSEKIIYWLPRSISLGFVLFISIFALDVFSDYSGYAILLPLFIHLIPSLFLLTVTLIAWKYELVGAIFYLGFAVLYVWDVGLTRPLSWYLAIVLPAFVVSLLYLISWIKRK